jgi:cyanophycin synthetase
MDNPKAIDIQRKQVFRGPNRYAYAKGILAIVDIGDLEEFPSDKIDDFNDTLISIIPSLDAHTCSYGVPGGFLRRLEEGTWMGHVMEHVAIEIQNLAAIDVTYGKTRQVKGDGEIGRTGKNSVYRVYFEFKNEETALYSLSLAKDLLNYIITPDFYPEFNFTKELEKVIDVAETFAYGPTTGSIVDEANSRGIPSIRLRKKWSLVQFGWGKNQKRIWASTSTNSSYISTEIAQDKELTLQLLYDVGIPVPRGGVATSLEEAMHQADRVGFPLVTKPLDVSHGRGVYLNINDIEDLKRGYEISSEFTSSVIVERYLPGADYRVLVINNQFVAASKRVPAHVIGDGKQTVAKLIEIVNQDPRRGIGHEKVLTRIKVDKNAIRLLENQNLTMESVPIDGKFVQLKSTANLSTGGTAIDVTNIIHYDNIKLAERAAKTIGLDIAGIDIISDDISKPIKSNSGAIIEVNAAPGFRMHLEPTEGKHRNVSKHVIDMLFPDGSDGRIPIIAVTGTNGKTTVSRWIAHILKLSGKNVGLTTTDGIYINGELEYAGDCTGPWSAKVVLRDPLVDFAVLETARGGILREGLGWDYCNVAAFLNVSDDHMGLQGINSIDEMAEVKGVILDQIVSDGYGILNADDPFVYDQRDRISGEIVLVSLNYKNPILLEHTEKGGIGVTITPNGVIQILHKKTQTTILHVKEIPATFGGYAVFNVQNAMFAVASSYPYVSIQDIRTGLSTFTTNFSSTPGRMNIESLKGARIIIDYGHNPAALEGQLQLVSGFHKDQGENGRKALVFGMPGDRPDDTIVSAAKIVANQYDRYFIKQDWRLRGREEGEVNKIIRDTLVAEGVSDDKIEIFQNELTELDAVSSMYEWLQVNDIVMLQADDVDKVRMHLFADLAKVRSIGGPHIRGSGEPEVEFDFASLTKNIRKIDEKSD